MPASGGFTGASDAPLPYNVLDIRFYPPPIMKLIVSSYVWEGHAGPSDVPQIVLVRRGLRRMSDGLYGVIDAEVLGRFVGFGEIRRWVHAGAPVRRALGTDSGHAATR